MSNVCVELVLGFERSPAERKLRRFDPRPTWAIDELNWKLASPIDSQLTWAIDELNWELASTFRSAAHVGH